MRSKDGFVGQGLHKEGQRGLARVSDRQFSLRPRASGVDNFPGAELIGGKAAIQD